MTCPTGPTGVGTQGQLPRSHPGHVTVALLLDGDDHPWKFGNWPVAPATLAGGTTYQI